eukprot:m.22557 g.22557  ORF g.22557 m.22557 type:complete len:358 (+) comp13854_c0_seq1:23-1096(+)
MSIVAFTFVAITALVSQPTAALLQVEDVEYSMFRRWKTDYSISYETEEENTERFNVWQQQFQKFGPGILSPYTDRTTTEFRQLFPLFDASTGPKPPPVFPFTAFSDAYVQKALATGVDWRARGAVTPVKNQGSHGVCGTFGQIQDAESQYALGGGGANPAKKPHPLVQFSEMQVLSCKTATVPSDAAVLFTYGAEPSVDYPFNESNWPDKTPPPCHMDMSKILPDSKPSNTTTIPSSAGEDQLAAMVFHNGPMQIGINSGILHLKDANGFISADACNANPLKSIDHSLGVVGFNNTKEHGDYWIIKNSWSQKWGVDGFVYLARNVKCGNFFAAGGHSYTYGPPEYYYEQSQGNVRVD